MESDKNEPDEPLDTSAARIAEFGMWLVVGSAAVAHVRQVVITRSVFGRNDTLAPLVVAALLLGVVRRRA